MKPEGLLVTHLQPSVTVPLAGLYRPQTMPQTITHPPESGLNEDLLASLKLSAYIKQ